MPVPPEKESKNNRRWGNFGEDYAALLLENKGYKIIERNFRSKLGEIDIVAEENGTLVFVEVKTRWSRKYGKAEEAVNFWKLRKIRKTADYYLLLHPESPKRMRIDVVAIEVNKGVAASAKIIKAL